MKNNSYNNTVVNHAQLTEWENAVLFRIASEEQLGEGVDGYISRPNSLYVDGDKRNIEGALGSLLNKGVIYDAYGGDPHPMWCTDVHGSPIAVEFCRLNGLDF